MPKHVLICIDPYDVGQDFVTDNQHRFCEDTPRHVQATIAEMSARWPNSSICIYKLKEMQKIETPPKYRMYVANDKGEILPK